MGAYKYLFIHCTATPAGREVNACDIKKWHTAPRPMERGGVFWQGQQYQNRNALPHVSICGEPIRMMSGRGWRQVGYSVLFQLDGTPLYLNEFDGNDWIDVREITNGAAGFNGTSRHICYAGGIDANGRTYDTRTEAQVEEMECFVLNEISLHPELIVVGHNQVSAKGCPSFNVPHWLNIIGAEQHAYR